MQPACTALRFSAWPGCVTNLKRRIPAPLARHRPLPSPPRRSFSAGVWARMGGMRFVRTAWAESPEAMQFAVTGTHVNPPGANVVEDVL